MWKKERRIFKRIKRRIEKAEEERTEFEKAIEKLLNEYDTADWENRFVVGGAMEVLFCALVNSLGFSSKWLKETRYDVEIEKVKFSLKSNFKGGGDIRLINVLGEESVSWAEPTIFFISELGICYADPSMGLQTRRTSDALVINTKEIKALVEENDEWLIRVKIPLKAGKRGKLRTASYSVAKAILDEIESKHLLNGLSKLAISGEERND